MNKIFLGTILFSLSSFAQVITSTIACKSLDELKITSQNLAKDSSIEAIHKATIEYDCKMLHPGDKIEIIGKPIENQYIQVNVKKLRSNYYISKKSVIDEEPVSNIEVSGSIVYERDFGDDHRNKKDRLNNAKERIKERRD